MFSIKPCLTAAACRRSLSSPLLPSLVQSVTQESVRRRQPLVLSSVCGSEHLPWGRAPYTPSHSHVRGGGRPCSCPVCTEGCWQQPPGPEGQETGQQSWNQTVWVPGGRGGSPAAGLRGRAVCLGPALEEDVLGEAGCKHVQVRGSEDMRALQSAGARARGAVWTGPLWSPWVKDGISGHFNFISPLKKNVFPEYFYN